MFEFQDVGVDWLRGQPRRFLGDEPGLGKTRQLLLAAEGDTLVVGPAMLEGVWADEAAKWTPGASPAFVSYSSLCATEKGPEGGTKTLPRLRPELRGHYDTVIFDEAHYLKGRNTNWTRAALRLDADVVWQASGTPIPNWADELFIPAQVLHPGDRDYTSYWRWAENWFDIWTQEWANSSREVGPLRKDRTWEQFHAANLGDAFLMRTWDELADQLPPLRHQTIEVDMTPSQKRFYQQLKKDFVAQVDGGMEVIAWNSGSQSTLLAKASFGVESVDPSARGGSGKLRIGRELLESWAGHPAILVTYFQSSAHRVAEMAKAAGREVLDVIGMPPRQRFDIAKRFQSGEGDTLVATIESIAEGLTLTRANRMCFFEKAYRPSRNNQVEKRIWRISQTEPCLVVDLVSRQSVDQRVRKLLGEKTDQQIKALRPREFAALL